MGKISDLAQAYASKYPEETKQSYAITYALGALMATEIIEDIINTQENLISQIALDRIRNEIKEMKK